MKTVMLHLYSKAAAAAAFTRRTQSG